MKVMFLQMCVLFMLDFGSVLLALESSASE